MATVKNHSSTVWASPELFCDVRSQFLNLAKNIELTSRVQSEGDELLNKKRVTSWLESKGTNHQENSEFDAETECLKAKNFLDWARAHSQLKAVSADVPDGILPKGFTGRLHDIKVFSRGPDDAIYDKDAGLRRKVARGNCILELKAPNQAAEFSCLVYALKKFTGGLGDDDDREQGDNFTWKLYFTKTLDDARSVVCTSKANGEAAHFSACVINGRVYLCAGSKNVHMIFCNRGDIERYGSNKQRFQIAMEVAHCFMDVLEAMPNETRQRFLEFLCICRVTGVAEILNPDHPHIEDLSHLAKPVMKFIAWTSNDLDASSEDQYFTSMPPNVSIEIARSFCLDAIDYTTIGPDKLDQRMLDIRQRHGVEGEVLVFLDEGSNVIGLLKKKSIWYVVVRAIREKAKGMATRYKKDHTLIDLTAENLKVEKRLDDIKKWLDLDTQCTETWQALAESFMLWTYKKLERSQINDADINLRFPIHWKKFLSETDSTDKIHLSGSTG